MHALSFCARGGSGVMMLFVSEASTVARPRAVPLAARVRRLPVRRRSRCRQSCSVSATAQPQTMPCEHPSRTTVVHPLTLAACVCSLGSHQTPIANRATSRCGRHRRRSSSARPSRATFRGQPLARPGTDERSDGRCGRQRPQRLIGPPFARPFPSPHGDRQSVRSEPLVISSSSSPPSHPSLHLSSSSAARLLLPFTCFPFPSCCLSAPVGVPPCRSSCLRIPCCNWGCCWRSVNQRRQTSEALCCAAASCCRRLH